MKQLSKKDASSSGDLGSSFLNPKLIDSVKSTRHFFALLCLVGLSAFVTLGVLDEDARLHYAIIAFIFLLIIPFIYIFAEAKEKHASPADTRPAEAQSENDVEPTRWGALAGRYHVNETPTHMGIDTDIYKARDVFLDREVAIKAFKCGSTKDELNSAKFQEFVSGSKAAQLISDLPNFLSVYEANLSSPDQCYLVMQYINGRTLRESITQCSGQGFDYAFVRRVILAVGDALVKAHERSFSHGNLKPSNVLVDDATLEPYLSPRTRLAQLSGFKLKDALRRNELTEEDMIYVAPEEIGLEIEDKELRDQYLLGLVAYDMLMGELPPRFCVSYRDEISHALLTSGLECFKELPYLSCLDKVPSYFSKIIARMTALHPKSRYPKLADAIADIRRAEHHTIMLARDSYVRCKERGDSEFFTAFYRNFTADAAIANFFKQVDEKGWDKQRDALERSLDASFDFVQACYGSEHIAEPNALTKIAKIHGAQGMNIDPHFYKHFVNSLVTTICDGSEDDSLNPFDYECRDNAVRRKEIEQAWRSLMKPVVDYLVLHR